MTMKNETEKCNQCWERQSQWETLRAYIEGAYEIAADPKYGTPLFVAVDAYRFVLDKMDRMERDYHGA